MKKGFRVLLIIAVCLIVIGIIISAASFFFIKDADFDRYSDAVAEKINYALRRFGIDNEVDIDIGADHFTVNEKNGNRKFGSGDTDTVTGDGVHSISAEAVRELEINWVAGEVEIRADDSTDEITFSEDFQGFSKPLNYKLSGNKLSIEFVKNGRFMNISGGKKLKVTIPYSYADRISEINVDVVSADCTITGLKTDEVNLNSVSGTVDIYGTFTDVDIDTVSGWVNIGSEKCPEDLEIGTTSGSIYLTLPENSAFSLEFNTVSGDFSTDLPFTVAGSKYIYGTGGGNFEIDTISGDLSISVG